MYVLLRNCQVLRCLPHTYPHPLDACTGNLLAVVQLQALQATAVLQVFQGHVGDEQAVVQFQYSQPLVATGAVAQVQDSIICDELTVGQTLQWAENRCLQDPHPKAHGLRKAGALACAVSQSSRVPTGSNTKP